MITVFIFIVATLVSGITKAEEIESIYITGGRDKAKKQPGSAHIVAKEQITEFHHTDAQRVLEKVPGVNIQEEDGEGLRPNIGLRGAHPHRSKKIVLMEDGILIAPAPYSAPAAYYFPSIMAMEDVEVFKGPLAIEYGPNTIGGAINLISRRIPYNSETFADIGGGSFDFRKLHLYHGNMKGQWGWLFEGMHLESQGFKELDGGGDTGFQRSNFAGKIQWSSPSSAQNFQQWTLKVGYSTEVSKETYLGITKDDFAKNSNRRYLASKLGNMDWTQSQIVLTHFGELGRVTINTDVYNNSYMRNWLKFNGFNGAGDARDVINNVEGTDKTLLDILRGSEDSSSPIGTDKLKIGGNDRSYYAKGVQTAVYVPLNADKKSQHSLKIGLRYHGDGIERDHTEDLYSMQNGQLVNDGSATKTTKTNVDSSSAISTYLNYKYESPKVQTITGVRIENVSTSRNDRSVDNADSENQDQVVSPGAGVYYQLEENIGLLFGVHKGYTLVGPGQADNIKPEEALNFEFGTRIFNGPTFAELIGFYSDYSNIKGTCTFSAGCSSTSIDTEYNGGEAEVYGAEFVLKNETPLSEGRKISATVNYTHTKALFTSKSSSTNPEWGVGTIVPGDPLPYIPDHQGSLRLGFGTPRFKSTISAKYTGKKYDQAVEAGGIALDPYVVCDWMNHYSLAENQDIYAGVDNLLDERYIVSLRPYGARPGKPRAIKLGVAAKF